MRVFICVSGMFTTIPPPGHMKSNLEFLERREKSEILDNCIQKLYLKNKQSIKVHINKVLFETFLTILKI